MAAPWNQCPLATALSVPASAQCGAHFHNQSNMAFISRSDFRREVRNQCPYNNDISPRTTLVHEHGNGNWEVLVEQVWECGAADVRVMYDCVPLDSIARVSQTTYTPSAATVFFADAADAEQRLARVCVAIYATRDEALFGRSAHVALGSRVGGCMCITIRDARLDTVKLAAVAVDVLHAAQTAEMASSGEARHNQRCQDFLTVSYLRQCLCNHTSAWSVTTDASFDTESAPCSYPDLAHMFANAPPPVTKHGRVVSFAGGNVAIATIDACCAASVAAGNDPDKHSDRSRLRAQCVKAGLEDFDATRHAACVHLLIAPGNTPYSTWDIGSGRRRYLLIGCSLAQITDMAYSLYAGLHDPGGITSLFPWDREAVGHDGLRNERYLRETYSSAIQTIAKCVRANLSAIKARLWKPNGRLVSTMMDGSHNS